LEEADPQLIPIHDRLIVLGDLTWMDTDLSKYEAVEQSIVEREFHSAKVRQRDHSKQQQSFHDRNNRGKAEREQSLFEDEERKLKEGELRGALARWRADYCDPTYEKLHSRFGETGALHRDITQTGGVLKVDEQVRLLGDVQTTFLEILTRLDLLTDELRRRQHQLKVYTTNDLDMVGKYKKEKGNEDAVLTEQRAEFKFEKERLHAQCVKFLVESGVDTLTFHKAALETEMNRILDTLPERIATGELPAENSKDVYPSDELIAQFKEVSEIVTMINRQIESLFGLLEQTDLNLITKETTPAIDQALTLENWTLAENLQASQSIKYNKTIEAHTSQRKRRDDANQLFLDRVRAYIVAHSSRKRERLNTIVSYAAGASVTGLNVVHRDGLMIQEIPNAMDTKYMGRMNGGDIGGSHTEYGYVYRP